MEASRDRISRNHQNEYCSSRNHGQVTLAATNNSETGFFHFQLKQKHSNHGDTGNYITYFPAI